MSALDAAEELRWMCLLAAELLDELVAESDRRDAELRARLAAFGEGYAAGFAAGRDVGYGQAAADLERDWHGMAKRVVALTTGPSLADLRARRQQYDTPALTPGQIRDRAARSWAKLTRGAGAA